MIVGRVIVDPVGAGDVAISVCGAAHLGGAGSDRVGEWVFLLAGIGGKI